MTAPNAFRRTNRSMDSLFSILLFLIFILCSVFIILIGSQVYSNIRARNDAAFLSDTALSYVTNKVRQSDKEGCIRIEEREGQEVLLLSSGTESPVYETLIYCRSGYLMELYSEQDSGLTLDAGIPIMECSEIHFSLSESTEVPLLTITLPEENQKNRIARLSLRSAKGGSTR